MTKKHFISLADALRDNNAAFSDRQINILADFCQSQNPRFKRHRWIAYLLGECGPNGGKIPSERAQESYTGQSRNRNPLKGGKNP